MDDDDVTSASLMYGSLGPIRDIMVCLLGHLGYRSMITTAFLRYPSWIDIQIATLLKRSPTKPTSYNQFE